MRLIVSLMMSAMLVASLPANAEMLKGGVDKAEILPQFNLQLLQAQLDKSVLPFAQNCACLNAKEVKAVNLNGRWRIVDGSRWLIDFGDKAEAAVKAAETIKHYGFTDMCTFGPGGPSALMQYFLVDDDAPAVAPIGNEDAMPLDIARVKAESIGGRWKVTAGNEWLLDFDQNQESAEHAADILRHYDFKYSCYVGRPGSPMSYYRK